mmetsp:Transcript_21238/g.53585  ORF Transcript_21238/g.53585 Transcript_21238/m.53585 type:complete len:193 (-) Transcript_21238:214-792(-)
MSCAGKRFARPHTHTSSKEQGIHTNTNTNTSTNSTTSPPDILRLRSVQGEIRLRHFRALQPVRKTFVLPENFWEHHVHIQTTAPNSGARRYLLAEKQACTNRLPVNSFVVHQGLFHRGAPNRFVLQDFLEQQPQQKTPPLLRGFVEHPSPIHTTTQGGLVQVRSLEQQPSRTTLRPPASSVEPIHIQTCLQV